MNQVLVAHDRDADKIPANIRDGVEIDGVVGNYMGSLGGRTINYLTGFTGFTDDAFGVIVSVLTTTYIIGLYDVVGGGGAHSVEIKKVNKTGSPLTVISGTSKDTLSWIESYYQEGTTIHCNYRDTSTSPADPYHSDYDIETDTWSASHTAGHNTTGTQLTSDTSIYDGLNYQFSYFDDVTTHSAREKIIIS